MTSGRMGKISAFCGYAREDARYLSELDVVLAPLREEFVIDTWSDPQIGVGTDWDAQIKRAIDSAHLVLFIVTPHLFESSYINEVEVPRSLERRAAGQCTVVSVLRAKPTFIEQWHDHPLAALQALPSRGLWIDDYPDIAAVNDEVRLGIREVCKGIADWENPYRAAAAGDWRHVERTMETNFGSANRWEVTEQVVDKNDVSAVVRVTSTEQGFADSKDIQVDLNLPLIDQAEATASQFGTDMSGLASMTTRFGESTFSEEVVSIGVTRYETTLETVTNRSELNGLAMTTRTLIWRSIDVPLDGVVQTRAEFEWSNGGTAVQTQKLMSAGRGDASSAMPDLHDRAPQPMLQPPMMQPPPMQQPPPTFVPAVGVGRWAIQSNEMTYDVVLQPDTSLYGVLWRNGVQSQLSGRWAFDQNLSMLRIEAQAMAPGFPPESFWVTFQLVDSDPAGYTVVDPGGVPFRLWRTG